jgi:hypothetical protein
MGNKVTFEGIVIRVEPDGFGVVKFDPAIGANTHGIFSPSTSDADLPFRDLKPGMHITGTAEIDHEDLAAVRSVRIE